MKENYYEMSHSEKDDYGRQIAEQYLKNYTGCTCTDFYYPKDIYSPYDVSFQCIDEYKTYDYVAELKYRVEFDHNAFQTIIVEKIKYDRLVEKIGNSKHKMIMIMWNDGYAHVYNLDQRPNYPLQWRLLPKNNVNKEEKVWKQVWEIPVKNCKLLRLQ